jgi:hypothetical protein
MKQQPIAEDLREHGHQHEADHAASPAQAAQDRETPPQLATLAEGELPQAGAGRPG